MTDINSGLDVAVLAMVGSTIGTRQFERARHAPLR